MTGPLGHLGSYLALEEIAYVAQNPFQSPNDKIMNGIENRRTFRWKPLLYRIVQIASWFIAALVTLGLAEVVREYRGAGQGASSPFWKLTGLSVLFNIIIWSAPTVIWLWLIHAQPIRNYFLSNYHQ